MAKGLTNHDLVDGTWISKKYGIPGDRYALFAMIRGDASDGLPGLKGIGEKGAAEIAKAFPDLDSALTAAKNRTDQIKPALIKKILESEKYALIAPKLVNCALDVPIPQIESKLSMDAIDEKEVRKLQERFGLGASVDRLLSAIEKK